MEGILSRHEFADRTVPDCILESKMNGAGATYRVLATALDKAGRRDLRKYVESQVEQQEEKRSDVSSKGKAPDPSSVKQPSTSASDRVVTTAAIQDLSENLFDEWRNVGRKLGIKEPKLQVIDTDNSIAREKVYQMLLTWKQSKRNEATYRILGEALQLAGRKDMQEYLYQHGSKPQWEEQCSTLYHLGERKWAIENQRSSWEKFEVDAQIVEAKNIIIYAAGRCGPADTIYLEIGYYSNLATFEEVSRRNNATLLHEQPTVFKKDGNPLNILLEKFEPMNWTYSNGKNPQTISFKEVAISPGSFCTFVLEKTEPKGSDACICYCKAGQAPNLRNFIFQLKALILHICERTEDQVSSPERSKADSDGYAHI